jgi:membrane-associated phospholipid phosphatase
MHLISRSLATVRVVIAVACVGLASSVRADGLTAGATDRVAVDAPLDAAITGLGLIGAVVPQIFSTELAPKVCRWCDGPIGSPPNPVDAWFHDRLTGAIFSRATSSSLSSVTAYALAPAVALSGAFLATGPYATSGAGWRAMMIVAESAALSSALTEAIKFSAGRQRPYVHYQHLSLPSEGNAFALSPEANLSFASGHTSLAASLGTSAAMVATLQESPAAPWLWGAAGLLTVSTGALRMMSESHYFTDVLAGAALGAGCGVFIPLLHRRGSPLGGVTAPSVATSGGGVSFSLAGSF